jgi:hypothetical protein
VLVRPLRREPLEPGLWVMAGRHLLDLRDWDLRMIYSDNF